MGRLVMIKSLYTFLTVRCTTVRHSQILKRKCQGGKKLTILKYKTHTGLGIFQEKGVLCTRKYSTYFQRDTEFYNTSTVSEEEKNTACQSSVCYPHSLHHEDIDIKILHLAIHKNNNNLTLKLICTLNIHFQLLSLCCVTCSQQDCEVTEPQITQVSP